MNKSVKLLASCLILFSTPLVADNNQQISVQKENAFKQWVSNFKKDAVSNGITTSRLILLLKTFN